MPQLLSSSGASESVIGSCEGKAGGEVGGRRKLWCFYSQELDVPSITTFG